MKKLLVIVLISTQLAANGFFFFRLAKLDHDIDHVYDFINTRVVATLNQDKAAIVYLREEIADIIVELTRKGLLDEAPPEALPNEVVPKKVPEEPPQITAYARSCAARAACLMRSHVLC